jgi:hypothetical protein
LSTSEKAIIETIVRDTPGEFVPAQIEATAIVLKRSPSAIARAVEDAKQRLQERASEYVDLHMDAAKKALEINEVGEARKAAEWALEHISATDDQGKRVSIVESKASESNAPTIKIGIALGGLPHARSDES